MLNSEDASSPKQDVTLPEMPDRLSPRAGADSAHNSESTDWQSHASEWESASLSDDEVDHTTKCDECNSPMDGNASAHGTANLDGTRLAAHFIPIDAPPPPRSYCDHSRIQEAFPISIYRLVIPPPAPLLPFHSCCLPQ